MFNIQRYMSTFALKKYNKMAKILTYLVKNDSKRVENNENYTGNFDNRLSTVDF